MSSVQRRYTVCSSALGGATWPRFCQIPRQVAGRFGTAGSLSANSFHRKRRLSAGCAPRGAADGADDRQADRAVQGNAREAEVLTPRTSTIDAGARLDKALGKIPWRIWTRRRCSFRGSPGGKRQSLHDQHGHQQAGYVIWHTKSLVEPVTSATRVGDARLALHHYQPIGGGGKRMAPTGDELAAIFKRMREHLSGSFA